MNEVFKLENQKQKNYPLIKEKLFKAAALSNYAALADTAWLFGNQDNAQKYGVPFHPLKACILSVYTNNRYGDLNKDAWIYCVAAFIPRTTVRKSSITPNRLKTGRPKSGQF